MNLPWQSADRHFVLVGSLVGSEFCPHVLVNVPYFPIRDDCADRMAHVVLSFFFFAIRMSQVSKSTGSKAAQLSSE